MGGHRALTLALAMTATTAQAADPLAAKFGAREDVQQMSLSPDGRHAAILSPGSGRTTMLLVADLEAGGNPKVILRSTGDPDRLTRCNWSTNSRLICNIYMIVTGTQTLDYTRVVAINSDGSGMKALSARTGDHAMGIMQDGGHLIDFNAAGGAGEVLMTRTFVPESTTFTHFGSRADGVGVERVDTVTLDRHMVEPARGIDTEYISDGHGFVRIMGLQQRTNSGYVKGAINYRYRKAGSRNWLDLSEVTNTAGVGSGFDPYAVDPALNVAYGFDELDGRRALYSVALDGGLKRSLVFARPDVDIASLVTIGRQQRVVGASYVTDRRETEFFDPQLKSLRTSLGKALPSQPLVTFIDASEDEGKLLMFAGSDTDPGRYYLFNKATRQLGEVLPARPQLSDLNLAPVKAISFRAADGTMIPGYLTMPVGGSGKDIPAIVMPHGGPGARDEWGFDWLAQFFVAHGYAVLQPNFRGSTGYGNTWFQKNGFQSWETAIGDVNDAGRWLIAQGIGAPSKLAIVGWSYGGYAALQSAVVDPDLFKAIIAIAPVTDLETLRQESRDYLNYPVVDHFIGHGPHVKAGSPARNAARIKAPVLLFHGDLDRNVGIGESRMMAGALRKAGGKVELVEFHKLDHQLDDAPARTQMLEKAAGFLDATLGH